MPLLFVYCYEGGGEMSGNQLGEEISKEPLGMGIYIFAPMSSEAGSPILYFVQPLLNGSVFASSAVIIGSEVLLLIAKHIFCLESIPVLDVKNGQTVQMPLSELQEFLKWMAKGTDYTTNSNLPIDGRNVLSTDRVLTGERGFLTPESPEAPLVIALYVSGSYSNRLYSPYISLNVPILVFPGLRGSLPLIILGLIGTIFVRAVVPPATTGSKPLVKQDTTNNQNNPLTFTPNDLLQLLTRFGKHFGSK